MAKLTPDDGRALRDVLVRAQLIEPRGERVLQRRRKLEPRERASRLAVAAVSGIEDHLGEFLDVERNAVGLVQNPLDHRGRKLLAGDAAHDRARLAIVEALQRDRKDIVMMHPGRIERRPDADEHQHWNSGDPFDEDFLQLDRGRVAPVRVFDDQEQRVLARAACHPPEQRLEDLLLALQGSSRLRGALVGERHQRRDPRQVLLVLWSSDGEHPLQGGELLLDRILSAEIRARDTVDHRIEGRRSVIGRTEILDRHRFLAHAVAHMADQARLADAGLADDRDDAAVSPSRDLPDIHDRLPLAPTANERALPGMTQRLEAIRHRLGAGDAPRPHRPGKSLQLARAEISDLEEVARERPGHLRDDDRVRLGHLLQPRCEDHGFADDRRLVEDAFVDRHQAGRDTNAHAQRHAACRYRFADSLDNAKCGADRPLRFGVMRARIAEEDQRPVAAQLRHMALERADDVVAAAHEGADDLVVLLRVERVRHPGRIDDVAEHRGKLSALAVKRGLGAVFAGGTREGPAAPAAEVRAGHVLGLATRAEDRHDAPCRSRLRLQGRMTRDLIVIVTAA